MSDHADPTVPKGVLIAVAAMLCFILALTGAVSAGLLPMEADPDASRAAANVAPEKQRALRFTDREDGAVLVTDATSGETVSVIPYGEGGFARATLRRLAKARKAVGVGAQPPFELTLWENGALSLTDPETGKTAELHGFGPDHSAMFAAMLEGAA